MPGVHHLGSFRHIAGTHRERDALVVQFDEGLALARSLSVRSMAKLSTARNLKIAKMGALLPSLVRATLLKSLNNASFFHLQVRSYLP